MNFRSSLLRLSELHRCKERLQTAICCLECLGEIKKKQQMEAFHSTDLFLFSHIPSNSVAPFSACKTHTQPKIPLIALKKANAQNVSL